jgi:hypothetical protein
MGIRLAIIGLVVALGLTALTGAAAIVIRRGGGRLGELTVAYLNSSSLPPGPADAHPAR